MNPIAAAGQPSDEEILKVWCQGWDTSEAWGAIKFARAVLTRWGQQPAPPPEGEVAELVAWLHGQDGGMVGRRAIYARIAQLLQRQAASVPVPVAKRLPGPEDCDAEGRCWLTSTAPGTFPGWILDDPEQCVDWDRWLPAHALPLPAQAGEVQP